MARGVIAERRRVRGMASGPAGIAVANRTHGGGATLPVLPRGPCGTAPDAVTCRGVPPDGAHPRRPDAQRAPLWTCPRDRKPALALLGDPRVAHTLPHRRALHRIAGCPCGDLVRRRRGVGDPGERLPLQRRCRGDAVHASELRPERLLSPRRGHGGARCTREHAGVRRPPAAERHRPDGTRPRDAERDVHRRRLRAAVEQSRLRRGTARAHVGHAQAGADQHRLPGELLC